MGNKMTRRCSTVDERYTRPQGLYPQRDVDQKKLRRLIIDSKLAPCFPGEDETSADSEECPICFLYYPSLNRSKCCSKSVCTECFLQMKSPRAARSTPCPFCKSHNYAVEYRGSKTLEEKGIEAAEEQKFIEAKIRMRKQELLEDEEREQRKEESERAATPPPPPAPIATGLVELSESSSSQQVKLPTTPDMTQTLSDVQAPSLNRACGAHCGASCAKCLMTFRRRRVYDVLDVITPQSGELFQAKPFLGRWRSTWGSHHSPLSRSFPFPSRMPEYHCRRHSTRILDSPLHSDGLKASNQELAQEDQSVTSGSCEEDLESSWVCEEYGSDGSLAPAPQPPLPCSERVVEPPPPPPQQQYQPGLVAPRHRDDKFDFDLEDIMVMEAIWQSIQDQGTRHGYTMSEPPRLSQPEMMNENVGVAVSESAGSEGDSREHHPLRMARGGLASAIAALAERRAVKGDATPPKKVLQDVSSSTGSPPEPVDVEVVESDLHASCSSDDGASTSASTLTCVAPVNSPVVTINRCATNADGKVMLPKSFEEQMMLAMALSLADAQSRARLEDMSVCL